MDLSRILVPLDLHESDDCKKLVSVAVDMAERYGASLTFVNVIDVGLSRAMIDRFKEVNNEYAHIAQQQLGKLVDRVIPKSIDHNVLVLSGRSYSTILAAADELNAELILISVHKADMKEYLLGMTAARVVRHASCSVMVVRTEQ